MANISRDQFDLDKGVQRKIHQKGSLLMDADLNEQAQVDLERHRRLISGLLTRSDARFDDGFKVIPNLTPLTVDILPGDAGFHLDDNHATLVTHPATTELTGFASWVSGGVTRIDMIFIDLEEKEISPEDDPDIINPTAGTETTRDLRLEYTIRIASDTSTLPTAPAGHVYRTLALVTKNATSDQILTDDIELILPNINEALQSMEIPIWTNASISNVSSDAQGLENDDFSFVIAEEGGGSKTNIVIKVPYVYDKAHSYLALHCQTLRMAGVEAWVRLDGFSETGTTATIKYSIPNVPRDAVSYLDIPSGLIEGQVYELQVALYGAATGQNYVWMYRPVITAGLGRFAHA